MEECIEAADAERDMREHAREIFERVANQGGETTAGLREAPIMMEQVMQQARDRIHEKFGELTFQDYAGAQVLCAALVDLVRAERLWHGETA